MLAIRNIAYIAQNFVTRKSFIMSSRICHSSVPIRLETMRRVGPSSRPKTWDITTNRALTKIGQASRPATTQQVPDFLIIGDLITQNASL